MKKAFTLIELILVIIIIGVLTALALSKFYDIRDNSEMAGDVKVSIAVQLAIYTKNLVPSVYLNLVDLEGKYNPNEVTLKDLITIDGENWNRSTDGNSITYNDTNLDIDSDNNQIIILELRRDRRITLIVDCDKYTNILYYQKCKSLAPNKISTLSF